MLSPLAAAAISLPSFFAVPVRIVAICLTDPQRLCNETRRLPRMRLHCSRRSCHPPSTLMRMLRRRHMHPHLQMAGQSRV